MRRRRFETAALGLVVALAGRAVAEEPSATPRGAGSAEAGVAQEVQAMLDAIDWDFRETAHLTGLERLSPRVREAIAKVPRHELVPQRFRAQAYANHPLPIGEGQTISQPYIVALMTELAELNPDDVVLEVGTGSGYQAAVLAELARQVYTIEIVEPLGRRAASDLERLGYRNVEVRIGDGWKGWPEHAPFDAILVTAAAGDVPPPLLDQLAPGGRLVLPLRAPFGDEVLTVVEKSAGGGVRRRPVIPVRFVPLTGDH